MITIITVTSTGPVLSQGHWDKGGGQECMHIAAFVSIGHTPCGQPYQLIDMWTPLIQATSSGGLHRWTEKYIQYNRNIKNHIQGGGL